MIPTISYNIDELTIADLLLEEILKLETSFRFGKKMLQTVHPYWLSFRKNDNLNKFIDIYGKKINYNIYDFYKPRNKFVNKLIDLKYKPPIKSIQKIKNDLLKFKNIFKFYAKNGSPSYFFDIHDFKIYVKCSKYFRLPKSPSEKINSSKNIDQMNIILNDYQIDFSNSIEEERKLINTFFEFLETTLQELVSTITVFKHNYIYSYGSIRYHLETRMNKRKSFKGYPEINDFILFIKLFPDSASEVYFQPPDIKLPNIANFEEKIIGNFELIA